MRPFKTNQAMVEALSLHPQGSLREAIAVIDRGAAQIALVTKSNSFVGVITDGDVCLVGGGHLDAGFEHFYFAVNYLKEQIQSHFQDGSAWRASVI